MRQIGQLMGSILLTILAASYSFAFDFYDNLDFIGFSRDGKYLAFEDSGSGSEASDISEYRTTFYIDAVRNSYASAPSILEVKNDVSARSSSAIERRYKADVALKLAKVGIKRGNLGDLVVLHLLSDWSFVTPTKNTRDFRRTDDNSKPVLTTDYEDAVVRRDKSTVEKIVFNNDLDTYLQNTYQFYELTLTSTPVKGDKDEAGSTFKMELTLKDNTQHRDIEPKILQKDIDTVPKSRETAMGYKIERVYLYDGKIAVFINVFVMGYEQAATQYMVVTGALPAQLNQ